MAHEIDEESRQIYENYKRMNKKIDKIFYILIFSNVFLIGVGAVLRFMFQSELLHNISNIIIFVGGISFFSSLISFVIIKLSDVYFWGSSSSNSGW